MSGTMLAVEAVSKRFGGVVANQAISISVDEGEIVGLIGPNGSGKTTLLNVIAGILRPDSGRVVVADTDVTALSEGGRDAFRAANLGYVFQTFNLLPRATSLHNVELPLIYAGMSSRDRKKKALHALDIVGLGDRSDHRPNELSGGQRQRVAIARALVNDPAILLADEPTGNLDSQMGEEIMRLLLELNDEHDTTVVMVTHDQKLAESTNRVVRLFDGRRVH